MICNLGQFVPLKKIKGKLLSKTSIETVSAVFLCSHIHSQSTRHFLLILSDRCFRAYSLATIAAYGKKRAFPGWLLEADSSREVNVVTNTYIVT